MSNNTIGIYGMGVMGQMIALNFARNGADVVVYNRTTSKTEDFLAGPAKGSGLRGEKELDAFVRALPRPRKVLLMIEAGGPTDKVIDGLVGLLDEGDIVIDGGNSFFRETERRAKALAENGLHFVGMGISGGEEGALKGPSIMPGGERAVYDQLEPLLQPVAAQTADGPCVAYIGPGGAGHLVKMVHNGIEYGDMQLIAEAYDVLRRVGGLFPHQMRQIFDQWNQTELSSYLIEITARIVDFPDDRGEGLLLDKILDAAGQKGTGRWTIQLAAELASPVPTMAAAVDARGLSSQQPRRLEAARKYPAPELTSDQPIETLIGNVHDALLASKICSYAQGFAMLRAASDEYRYDLDLAEVARIWQGGCIIRAGFLKSISRAYRQTPSLDNLLMDDYFADLVRRCQTGWRKVVGLAAHTGIAAPAMAGSLAYFDSLRSDRLPAYLIQAQRDFFGAHTYKRLDQDGTFHTHWPEMIE